MDTELARTFLTVLDYGSFVRAAGKLFVTQSTVSARIRLLEDQLGTALFTRNRDGVCPTTAALRFQGPATTIVRAWAQARQDAALPNSLSVGLTLGAQVTHWDGGLVEWVAWLRDACPAVALRAEVADNDLLLRQLEDGLLDAAIVYRPRQADGLVAEELFKDDLILVGCGPDAGRPGDPGYVFVDWGADYRAAHALSFGDREQPSLRFSIGSPALDVILKCGGSAYFPYRMVQEHLKSGNLHPVASAPRFERPVYLLRPEQAADARISVALDGLREIFVPGPAVSI